MSSPFCLAILLIVTMLIGPATGLAADAPVSIVVELPSSSTVTVVDTIPTLLSVDLTARTGHIGVSAQMAQTKIKDLNWKVWAAIIGAAAVIWFFWALSHAEGNIVIH